MTPPTISGTTPHTATSMSLGANDDAMSALYTSLSDLRQGQLTLGEDRIEEDETQQQQQNAAQQAALAQAQANQANSGHGFFSCVGHFVGDVTRDLVHGRLGSAIDDAGHDVDQAYNSPKFWNDLEKGMAGAAIVAAAVVTTVVTFGSGSVAAAVVIAAAASAAAASGTAAAAAARSQHFAATAQDANADATAAGDQIQELQMVTAEVLTDVKQTDKSHQRALQSLVQATQTNDDTLAAPAAMTVRG